MPLRAYQADAVDRCVAALARGARPILVSPTGSGKTTMGVALIAHLGVPTLWIAHRRELIEQARDRLIHEGINPRVICASVDPLPGPYGDVTVASVQTLARRKMPDRVGLVVIDEAHHAVSTSYERFYGLPTIGLTATPFRLDGAGLGSAGFTDLVVAATPTELIAQGYIVEPQYFSIPAPKLQSYAKVAGEYKSSVMFDAMSKPTIIGDIVATWRKHANNERTVMFAVNVEHSKMLVARFVAAGIAAEHVDGTTPGDQRAATLRRLNSGETRIVSNCMVFGEGVDLPTLSVCILARPTASLGLYLQMVGRIMRPAPEKTRALVLDHAGNCVLHGFAEQELEYSLDVAVKKSTAPLCNVKNCKQCYALVPRIAEVCPVCGYVFAAERKPIVEGSGELVEFKNASSGLAAVTDEQREFFASLIALSQDRQYKDGFVALRYKHRYGQWPVMVVVAGEHRLVCPLTAGPTERAAVYADLIATAKERNYKPGWAAVRYKQIFGRWPATSRPEFARA